MKKKNLSLSPLDHLSYSAEFLNYVIARQAKLSLDEIQLIENPRVLVAGWVKFDAWVI